MRNSYLIPTEYGRLDQIAESPEFKAVLHLKLHGSQVEAIHREYSTLPVASRLVTTEKNRFGRVGIHVEAGDLIALVSDQKLPMLLRRLGEIISLWAQVMFLVSCMGRHGLAKALD